MILLIMQFQGYGRIICDKWEKERLLLKVIEKEKKEKKEGEENKNKKTIGKESKAFLYNF